MASIAARRRSPIFWQNIWGVAFILPAMALLLVFNLYPLFNALYISFTSWTLQGSPQFVGFHNYVTIFTQDVEFRRSLWVTLIYALGLNPLMWALALGLAMLFNRRFALLGVFRAIYFSPVIVSWVVASIVWMTIFHPSYGINPAFFRLFGRPGVPWLQDPGLVVPALIVLSLWKNVGYYMVLFLAGLQSISGEHLEAASCDGANAWQRFWYITLPLLKPTTLFVMVISIINSFQVFTPIYIMTRGGPAGASRVLPLLVYENAFNYLKMGYATSLAVVLFVVLMALTLLQMRAFRGGEVG